MKELAEALKAKKRVVLLTGAGMSTECGIPDFRSTGGYWHGKEYEEVLKNQNTGTMAFRAFVLKLLEDIEKATKHEGYAILEEWTKQGFIHEIITQNVDGFHENALEYHGGLSHYFCEECDTPTTKEDFIENKVCHVCKLDMMIRPDMVLYGEHIDPMIAHLAEEAVKEADLLIVMGTSLQVKPFAGLVDIYLQSHHYKGSLWIINQSETPYTKYATYKSEESIVKWLKQVNEYID